MLIQSCLGTSDLGILYHEPIREANGSIVIVAVKNIASRDLRLPIASVSTFSWQTAETISTKIPSVCIS